MKIELHPADSRGESKTDWLLSRHSFSFNQYHNPVRMGFGALRVLNDDAIAAGTGFGMHRHDHMEVVTIVLEGALQHKDSTGSEGVIRAGDVQRMSAGTGIMHSEMNASENEEGKFLQIWIVPSTKFVKPGYEQKHFDLPQDALVKLIENGNPDALQIHQEAAMLMGSFSEGKEIRYTKIKQKHGVFVFVIDGSVSLDGAVLGARDAAALSDTEEIALHMNKPSTVLLIDVPL